MKKQVVGFVGLGHIADAARTISGEWKGQRSDCRGFSRS